jgi:hypothetical protein
MADNSKSSSAGGGLGFTGALAILFIALKVTHEIGWSWWWVLSPLWISGAVAVFILLVAAVFVGVAALLKR